MSSRTSKPKLNPSEILKHTRSLLYKKKDFTIHNKTNSKAHRKTKSNYRIEYLDHILIRNNQKINFKPVYTGEIIKADDEWNEDNTYIYKHGEGTIHFNFTIPKQPQEGEPLRLINTMSSESWIYDLPYNDITITFVEEPTKIYTTDKNLCSICHEDLLCHDANYFNHAECKKNLNGLCILYNCGHFFHISCIKRYITARLNNNGSTNSFPCPFCRTDTLFPQEVINIGVYIETLSNKPQIYKTSGNRGGKRKKRTRTRKIYKMFHFDCSTV